MPHLISNLVEKSYTPSTARLAPKNLWSKHSMGRKPAKTTRFSRDPTVKATWRLIRSWICHNHKLYYSYVIACGFFVYQFWWATCVGYYRRRNHHRSLPVAIQREKEWDLIKPKDDEYDDEEESESEAAAEEE
jgi:hypothetical protein